MEPSGASSGTVPVPRGFLKDVRRITAERGVYLVFDEVISGFRWAPGGVQEVSGVTADLVTMAKILAGGLPGGAVGGRRDLLEPIGMPRSNRRKIQHPGTYNANPLSASAGIACLDYIRDGRAQTQAADTAAALRRGLNTVLATLGVRGAVYGESSGFHVAFDRGITPGDPATAAVLSPEVLKQQRGLPPAGPLTVALLMRGVHLFGLGGFTSVAHGPEDVARTVDAFGPALREIERWLPS